MAAAAGRPEAGCRDPRQKQRPSTAITRLRAMSFSSRASAFVSLHRQPQIEERRIVIRSANVGAVESFVPNVLQPDAGVEPRPARRGAADEWDVGKLGDPAGTVRTEAAGQ